MDNKTNTSEIIINTINTIFDNLFSSIDISMYKILDKLTFIDSDILKDKNFEKIFGTNQTNGLLLICNSLIIGFIIYYGIKYFSNNFNDSKIENPWKFILKIIIFGICMNSSFFIVEQLLNINFNITEGIRSIGEDIFKQKIGFTGLIENINKNIKISGEHINIFSIDGIIKGTLTMSLLNLLTTYALRYVGIKIFVLISPFAILSLSMEKTAWIFKIWIKNLISLLLVQIIISIILLVIFSLNYENSEEITKFIYLGGIYALMKANSYIKDFIMRGVI